MSRPPLSRFFASSTGGDNLPNAWTKEEFDPKTYKMMERLVMTFKTQLP